MFLQKKSSQLNSRKKGLFAKMDLAVEGSESLESGSTVDLQNEQSYLSEGGLPDSPSNVQISGRKCEPRKK